MLPGTAKEMAQKLGLPFRPDLLRSNAPEALDYQRRLGSAYLQEGLSKTGNMRDALRYYHGGPDRSMWGPKTNAYADAVLARLSGKVAF
jgi:soluble lytic murein transglycosylase-like protein